MTTVKMVNEWINLYVDEKLNCHQIGEMYGVNNATVRYHLHQHGLQTPRPKHYRSFVGCHKHKYVICVYDMNDLLVWQFNNAKEMAKTLNRPLNSIQCRLTPSHDKNVKLRHNCEWYRVCLVEVDYDNNKDN